MLVAASLLALGFMLIHLLIGRLAFLRAIPRSRWLSAAGGVAVAYVFLHVLPELAEGRACASISSLPARPSVDTST